ncbi:predicted protein [Aspergillus nidulans FGSC A4]|uniref:Uncharacterized protein n=1 Tax=Emericella nidulans (strain FGSC A4 / ATCC 38163 / CBS 112.46 / NRRL 194 / M139) TaxID=227321 RepID=Q5BCH5_EMENI|nr:hypothetical protein [Aspergillus nidulans FGSC A4]EAA64041.1 predicted protein [Aspergillus nidulans FGSC A4]CBF85501.1 TPA: hypothetical protein ANIA_01755 [Aspergillus nidulans FGSC A4]|eukprot:XP_659359.1 predicted protein [Aspergillus nidulans FGSC A4]
MSIRIPNHEHGPRTRKGNTAVNMRVHEPIEPRVGGPLLRLLKTNPTDAEAAEGTPARIITGSEQPGVLERIVSHDFGEILVSESIIATVKDGTRRARRKTTWDEDEAVAKAECIGS